MGIPHNSEERAKMKAAGAERLKANLNRITSGMVDLLLEKRKGYGESWKKRGGTGAFHVLARKWDRIEEQSAERDYNIFEAYKSSPEIQDDVKDLVGYLLLVMEDQEDAVKEEQK